MSKKSTKRKTKRKPVKKTKKKLKSNLPKKFLTEGGPGRTKGSKNKFTDLKNAFLQVFDKLGGVEGFFQWASKNNLNKTQFYHMITKLLPKAIDVSASDSMTEYVTLMSRLWGSKKKVDK